MSLDHRLRCLSVSRQRDLAGQRLVQPSGRGLSPTCCEFLPSLLSLELLTVLQLEYAHEVAPNVKLYINDYNIESMNNKSLAYAELARSLLDQGAPLDGIGFQCHFIGGQVPDDIAETVNMFTDMGLEVAFTELDIRVPVNNRGLTNSTWLDIQSVISSRARR